MTVATNEDLGRIVRDVWVAYAIEHGDTKPSHLAGWDDLDEYDREVDRRIGIAIRDAVVDRLIHAARNDALAVFIESPEHLENWLDLRGKGGAR